MAVGDRIPADFIAARKSRRILKALAELLDEKGYRATKIADIVRQAGVARKTFYDNFGGKDDAARALVAQALPDLHGWVDLASIERTGLSLLAVELSAAAVAREGHDVAARATSALDSLRGLPDSIHPAEPASELLCSLPPGRHGLPREFIAHNQRARLLHAFPAAVVEHGYQPVTVADVTKVAHLSRRTFYQHFKVNSGLGTLAVEVVAAGVCEGTRAAASMVAEIEEALRPIAGAHLEQVAA